MQQFINTLFNPEVLDKLGLAGVTLDGCALSWGGSMRRPPFFFWR